MEEILQGDYTEDQWYDFVLQHYIMIQKEFDAASENSEIESSVYSRLVVSCIFFSFLRGEFFSTVRPGGLGEKQRELYKMETELFQKLETLKSQVNLDSDTIQTQKRELDFWF